MKKSTIAATLNFGIPGAGFWYLGKRSLAIANLLVATAIVFLLAGYVPAAERIHYVILAVAAGSAGLAHAIGSRADEESRGRSVGSDAANVTSGKSASQS